MNPCFPPLAWGSGSATRTSISRSGSRGEPGEKWWKSCTDLVSGSGGWGRTGLNSQSFRSQVTDSKLDWNNVTARIEAFSVDYSAIWLTFDLTFSSSGFNILSVWNCFYSRLLLFFPPSFEAFFSSTTRSQNKLWINCSWTVILIFCFLWLKQKSGCYIF